MNPLGISYQLRQELPSQIDAITSYPDREYTSLRKAIGEYILADYENILVGNGATELISLLMQILRPKHALIIGPTYSEYEHEITLGGGHFDYFELKETENFLLREEALFPALTPDIDLLVICNPNNPTSSLIAREDMRHILEHCKKNGIFVMVDETYIEFSENCSGLTAVPLAQDYQNLIILRGISKFFAAPGLRLGYAVCSSRRLRNDIERFKNPWTINSLAVAAAQIMFQDRQYIEDTKQLICTERRRICSILDQYQGLKYYTPHANFVLVHILEKSITGKELFEDAIQKNFMIRDCSSFPFLDNKFVRFCFMKPEENDALLKILLHKFKKKRD